VTDRGEGSESERVTERGGEIEREGIRGEERKIERVTERGRRERERVRG